MAQTVKRLPIMQETQVQSLGWKDLLEKEMATHSSILAWKIPWMEEPGRLQSMGSQRVGHDWATSLHLTSLEIDSVGLTLWDPKDCSPPDSSVHGILQERILEWVAFSFSRGSSQSRDRTQVSLIAGRCFTLWATRAWFFCLFCWLPMLKKAIGKILTVQMIKKHVVPQPL